MKSSLISRIQVKLNPKLHRAHKVVNLALKGIVKTTPCIECGEIETLHARNIDDYIREESRKGTTVIYWNKEEEKVFNEFLFNNGLRPNPETFYNIEQKYESRNIKLY